MIETETTKSKVQDENLTYKLLIIGEFMGKAFGNPLNYMYDKDWNYLMEACKKFDRLNLSDKEYELLCDEIDDAVSCYEIKPVFENLFAGILWYNTNYNK